MADVEDNPLEGVIEVALRKAGDGEVSIAQLLDAFGDRSFGPILTALGLFVVSPIGAIPLVPSVIAVIVILISAQLTFGRDYPWLPQRLGSFAFKRDKIKSVSDKAGPVLRRIDSVISRRLTWATGDILRRLAGMFCIILAALIVPLELVPFAVVLPGTAIILFGLAISVRDGVLMILASVTTVVAAYFSWIWLNS